MISSPLLINSSPIPLSVEQWLVMSLVSVLIKRGLFFSTFKQNMIFIAK
jgi:hypothetical protein